MIASVNSRATRYVLLLSQLGLAACTCLQPGYEQPTVAISSFRAVPGSGAVPGFEIGLRVLNPNLAPLELAGMSYTVSLDGHEIIKGVGNELPVIEGYGEGEFTVHAVVSLFGGIQLFRDLMNKPSDVFTYEFVAKLDPGALQPAIRVRETGEMSLSQTGR